MDLYSGVCGLYCINCGFRSLKGKASIGNPVYKLYSLAYKVQQTFLVPAKHELVNNMKHA